jgi:hypothetical protein
MPGSLRMSTMFESAAPSEPNEFSRPASHAATSAAAVRGLSSFAVAGQRLMPEDTG